MSEFSRQPEHWTRNQELSRLDGYFKRLDEKYNAMDHETGDSYEWHIVPAGMTFRCRLVNGHKLVSYIKNSEGIDSEPLVHGKDQPFYAKALGARIGRNENNLYLFGDKAVYDDAQIRIATIPLNRFKFNANRTDLIYEVFEN